MFYLFCYFYQRYQHNSFIFYHFKTIPIDFLNYNFYSKKHEDHPHPLPPLPSHQHPIPNIYMFFLHPSHLHLGLPRLLSWLLLRPMLIQYLLFYSDYLAHQGKCFYQPKNTTDNCCLQFNSASKCTQCAPGLLVINGLCKDVKIPGCIKKSNSGCQLCAQGYALKNGYCIPSISGCLDYDQSNACIQCSSKYMIKLGTCLPLITLQPIPNCKYQNEYGCG